MTTWKGLDYRSQYKPGGEKWNRVWEDDPNQLQHEGNWNWMNISKKQARKMSSRDWHRRFAEAGLYETGNNRSERISTDAWRDLGWKRRTWRTGDGSNEYWEWKGDKKTKEKAWKLYGELTGMTRFSDIGKKNYEDINWKAKFKDREDGWNDALEEEWGGLTAEQKWAKYSLLKEEVPEDYDDVAGKDAEEELRREIDLGPMPPAHDFGPDIPDFVKDPEGGHDYDYGGPMFDGDEVSDERDPETGKYLYKPNPIGSLEDVIRDQMGKDSPHEGGELLAHVQNERLTNPDYPADPRSTWWDPAANNGQGAYRTAQGHVTDRPDVDPRDPESVTGEDAIGLPKPHLRDSDMDGELDSATETLAEGLDLKEKGVIKTSSGIDTPTDVADVTHMTGDTTGTTLTDTTLDQGASTTAELGTEGQSAITAASKTFDDQPAVPAPRDPNDPRDQPAPPDATAWQGASAGARMEGLGTEFAKYDTFPKTGTNTQITSALGSRLKRSQAAKTGRNTLGTGAFKFRNPLSIN